MTTLTEDLFNESQKSLAYWKSEHDRIKIIMLSALEWIASGMAYGHDFTAEEMQDFAQDAIDKVRKCPKP